MKTIIAILLCLALPVMGGVMVINSFKVAAPGGGGGITFIVSTSKAGTSSPGVTTDAIDTTGANLIIVSTSGYTSPVTLTDSKSNSWTALTGQTNSTLECKLWYCLNPTVGGGHTFTNGTASYPAISVAAYSGVGSFDAESGANGASVSTLQPGSITPAANDSLIVTAVATYSEGTTAVDSGFTIIESEPTGASFGNYLATKLLPTAAATNPTWSGGGIYAAVMAVFKP